MSVKRLVSWAFGIIALLLMGAVAWAQNANTNPVPGNVWTYLGATFGAGWAPASLAGGAPLIEQYGADPSGSVDSSTAILACANYVSAHGGGYCRALASSKILVTTSFAFPKNSGLDCGQGALGNPGSSRSPGLSSPYDTMGGIRLAATATISYNSNFMLRNCLVYRSGMTFPAADASAYAGTAFQAAANGGNGANDAVFENVQIIGFNLLLDASGDRLRVNNFFGDGNNCITLNNSFDTSSLEHVHCYPYGTVATNGCGPTTTNCQRSGIGIAVYAESDDTTFGEDILVLGYLTNFYINGTNLHFGKIWSDYAGVPNPAATGVKFGPAADQMTIGSIMNYTSYTGIDVPQPTGRIQIGSIVSQFNTGDCMHVLGGWFKIQSFISHGCGAWHINNGNTTGDLSIDALDFYNFQTSSKPCPIGLVSGITTDRAYFGRITGDGSFACVVGGFPLEQPALTIAGTFLTLSNGATTSTHYIVVGATGTVNSMTEGYGSRPVTLFFQNSGLTITQSTTGCTVGQFLNLSGANITTVAGRPYTFFFDGSGTGCWRQQS
jgi:hypothetical protein